MRILTVLLLILAAAAGSTHAADPTVQELLDAVGIKPTDGQRGQMDVVGFVTTAAQMDAVLEQCRDLAAPREKELLAQYGWKKETPFFAAVCPHDDYYYAGRLYTLLMPHVRARTVILLGVFHKARVFDCRDKLVFDSFDTWRGPYGPVKVSLLRGEIIARLPEADYVVDNDMQMVEHSIEAIVPFLQAYNRDVEIVSILVPYMGWDTMERLAGELSGAIASILNERGLKLGRDVCLITSSDAIHYGDSGWGGSDFAEYGTDTKGYQQAVARDLDLAENLLCGTVKPAKLQQFLYACVDPGDVTRYLVTWCGRFSIPFGLDVASRLAGALESRSLQGRLLDYGTSVSEASLEVEGLDGLGVTAPNNFHHFVGYAAIGYE